MPSCLPPRALSLHSCLETLDHWTKTREGLSENPLTNPEEIWYTDGSSYVLNGKTARYAVVSNLETIEAKPLPPGTSPQLAELIALTRALELGKGEKSSHLHGFQVCLSGTISTCFCLKRKTTWPPEVIKYGNQILGHLEAVYLPAELSITHCRRHQKGSTEVARGGQAANQAAKRAALQNNDLIGVATLVPQTNLPETPSYTEGETLKAKSEGFQEDHMGWFQKEGLLSFPGSLQWKLVNSLHTTTHLGGKTLQRLLERSFRGTSLQMTIR